MSARRHEDGFTLIEVLVSLAIFSIAIVGLQRAATLAVRGTSQLELRTHAGFVADNAVVLSRLQPRREAVQREAARSGGIDFVTAVQTVPTELERFYEIRVDVRQDGSDTVIASRRAFRLEPPLRVAPPNREDADEGDDE